MLLGTKTGSRSFLLLVVIMGFMALSLWSGGTPTMQAQGDDPPWPMFRYDSMHTGRSPHTGPENPATKWSFETEGSIASSPVIGTDGTIYVGSNDKKLYAVNPDGSMKWSFTTQGAITSSPAIGTDGTIYVGNNAKKLYALNPDGTEKWGFDTQEAIGSSAVIGDDGTIYVTTYDGDIYAINPDGDEKWSSETRRQDSSKVLSRLSDRVGTTTPVIGADGTIYVGSDGVRMGGVPSSSFSGRLFAFSPEGSEEWGVNTKGGIRSSPAIGADGTIYVGAESDRFYAINPDGSVKWFFFTGDITLDNVQPAFYSSSPALGADGTIYVGSNDHNLYALNPDRNPKTGQGVSKWSFTTAGVVTSSPAIGADGTIYVGSADMKLYAINPDGSEKWHFTTQGAIASSPAIAADGTIYIGSSDNNLYAVADASTLPAAAVQQESVETSDGTGTNIPLLIIIPVMIVVPILLFLVFRRRRRTSGTS